jgi:hypothetical protein
MNVLPDAGLVTEQRDGRESAAIASPATQLRSVRDWMANYGRL